MFPRTHSHLRYFGKHLNDGALYIEWDYLLQLQVKCNLCENESNKYLTKVQAFLQWLFREFSIQSNKE